MLSTKYVASIAHFLIFQMAFSPPSLLSDHSLGIPTANSSTQISLKLTKKKGGGDWGAPCTLEQASTQIPFLGLRILSLLPYSVTLLSVPAFIYKLHQ